MTNNPFIPINPNPPDYISEELEGIQIPSTQLGPGIDKSRFITIPNTNTLITKEEIHKGLDFQDSHFALNENGLYMPPPSKFMPYFLEVKSAAQGTTTLYDGNNNPI